MRYLIIIFLCVTSVCLAQETYHNEEFGFTIDIPSEWHISFEDEWSDKVKIALEQLYLSKVLFMLNPSGVKAPDAPCIRAFGQMGGMKTHLRIAYVKKNGQRVLTSRMENAANEVLGQKIKQYRKIDTFYDYDSSRNLAIAKLIYKHNDEKNTHFVLTRAMFIGLQRVVNFQGYWKGVEPEEFWQVFREVVDSFRFEQDVKVKEESFNRILKWGSIILTISIILGFVKMLLLKKRKQKTKS